jgi:hypothetical protein
MSKRVTSSSEEIHEQAINKQIMEIKTQSKKEQLLAFQKSHNKLTYESDEYEICNLQLVCDAGELMIANLLYDTGQRMIAKLLSAPIEEKDIIDLVGVREEKDEG